MKKLFHQFKTLFSNSQKNQQPARLSPEQIAKIKESSAEFTTVLDTLKQDLLKIHKDEYLKDLNKKATETKATEKKPTAKKPTPAKKPATAKKTTPATKPVVKKASPKKPSK